MLRIAALVSVLTINALISSMTQADCRAQRTNRMTMVGKVVDGDTLELVDHTRVRLIGINAPELGRYTQPAQAFAVQATTTLKALLVQSDYRIALQYGSDNKDRYGRTLAHVFLPDGTNVAQQLLDKGLAVRVAFPPNMWAQDCYRQAESRARTLQRGLWQHIITTADKLTANSKGFHIIEGRIDRVAFSNKSVWLNFKGQVAVRIARSDQKYFNAIDFKQLAGRIVQVRGWIYGTGHRRIMRLQHSSMLDIMK